MLTSFTVTDDDLVFFFGEVLPHLDGRQRRITGAAARALGHGGVKAVAVASGLSLSTVQKDTGLAVVVCHFPPVAGTTTRTGLTVRAELDHGVYQKGIKVTDREMKPLPIVKHKFHGDWNYTIKSRWTSSIKKVSNLNTGSNHPIRGGRPG